MQVSADRQVKLQAGLSKLVVGSKEKDAVSKSDVPRRPEVGVWDAIVSVHLKKIVKTHR